MKTGPAEGAADPVKGAADEEPPTVLLGALKVKVPNGETLVLQTTFDTGSDTDAVSETVATRLKELGVSWGEAGGGVRMAVSSATVHTATPQGDTGGHPATPRTSGNARDHLATPGPIWQRQVPYGNAKCDLDAADAPQDS